MSSNDEIEAQGIDTDGKEYSSLQEMWKHEIDFRNQVEGEGSWYRKAVLCSTDEYWKRICTFDNEKKSVEATDNGMLGGFESISKPDIQGSKKFIHDLWKNSNSSREYALDCGAGVGRVTKYVLSPLFKKVDLVEQNPIFVESARNNLKDLKNVIHFMVCGLQDFDFTYQGVRKQYDLIWIQWVIAHLHDEDVIKFMNRCKEALMPRGFIVMKENISRSGFVVDKTDSSITRTDEHIRALIAKSGMKLVKTRLQTGFPQEIFPVRMYALQPLS